MSKSRKMPMTKTWQKMFDNKKCLIIKKKYIIFDLDWILINHEQCNFTGHVKYAGIFSLHDKNLYFLMKNCTVIHIITLDDTEWRIQKFNSNHHLFFSWIIQYWISLNILQS